MVYILGLIPFPIFTPTPHFQVPMLSSTVVTSTG